MEPPAPIKKKLGMKKRLVSRNVGNLTNNLNYAQIRKKLLTGLATKFIKPKPVT